MIFLNLLIIFNRKKREGIELVLGKIFGDIGFNQIIDPIFKQLVLYRLVYPGSNLKTTEYLYPYHQIYTKAKNN